MCVCVFLSMECTWLQVLQNMKQVYKEETNSNEMGSALQGKRSLVAAIMDLVHSSCDAGDGITGFRPMLPGSFAHLLKRL